ncbi:MAG: hypothetical protein FWD68_08385 [Alphaproteobacteria bacterium]|nr:hypothetical protein [Alphaproteobacteria bacterium]
MNEFLDHFYSLDTAGKIAALADEPATLSKASDDCLMAAMAEHLAKCYAHSPAPAWTAKPHRYLPEPCFLTIFNDPGLHEYLTLVSPAAFKHRNLFTDNVVFARARQRPASSQSRASTSEESAATAPPSRDAAPQSVT